jgi:hypothetical protein
MSDLRLKNCPDCEKYFSSIGKKNLMRGFIQPINGNCRVIRHGLNMHYTNPKKCSNDSCDHVFDSVQYKHGKSAISFCPKCRTKNELKTAEIIENVDRRDLTHNEKLSRTVKRSVTGSA